MGQEPVEKEAQASAAQPSGNGSSIGPTSPVIWNRKRVHFTFRTTTGKRQLDWAQQPFVLVQNKLALLLSRARGKWQLDWAHQPSDLVHNKCTRFYLGQPPENGKLSWALQVTRPVAL